MNAAFTTSFYRELAFLRSSFWDRALVTWVPLLLLGIIALQLSAGAMHKLPIIVVDQDKSGIARQLIQRLDTSSGLMVKAQTNNMAEAQKLVRSSKAYAIAYIPKDTEQAVLRGSTGKILIFYNASYSTPAGAALREINAVVQELSGSLAIGQAAAVLGPDKLRPPPIAVHSQILFNPQTSYEFQLVTLIHPALLHLLFMIAVVSALGRELRDGTIGTWLSDMPRRDALMAVAGKLSPYLVIFFLWGLLATAYLAGLRGWPIHGSVVMILIGYIALYLAYTAVALAFVGLSLAMGQALSFTALYAGASFAFAGAIFPIESSSTFAQIWSSLLPYTAFAKLIAEQWMMGAPALISIKPLLIMAAFIPLGTVAGLPRYLNAAYRPEVWGRR